MKPYVIIVTGTPCTGKTRYAKALAKQKFYQYVDVNEIIKKYNLSEGYDKENDCEIVDTEKLAQELIKLIKAKKSGGFVIDSHLSHYLLKEYADECIVMKCSDLDKLKKRLKLRGYSDKKIKDNLEAEIMDSCLNEAKEFGHKVKIVETSED